MIEDFTVDVFAKESDCKGDVFRMFLLDELAWKAELDGEDVIRLTLGKTDFQLQASIRNRMIQTINDIDESNFVFPLGLPKLKKELVLHYKKSIGVKINEENIFIDSGTSSIFRNILQMIISEGDEVLLPMPNYPLYKISSQLANAEIRYYNIDKNSLEIDLDTIRNNVSSKTRAIILNSPGNPVGNIISREKLIDIVNILPDGIFLIFDEIYENAKFNGEPSITQYLLSDRRFNNTNIVITNSFSKAYRMYTKRVGWCILPDTLSCKMLEILHHTRLTVDPSVQFGALEALAHTNDIKILNDAHKCRWEYTKQVFLSVNSIHLYESKGGFYCTIDCHDFIMNNGIENCYELAVDILNKTGVALVPGQDFGWPGTLRISFTNKRYTEAMDRLLEYFKS